MSRAEEACAALPSWALRTIVRWSTHDGWWWAAWVELFKDDDDRRRTVSLLVAVAFRESSLRNDAVGDHGQSFCAFQIHRTNGGGKALTEDAEACVRKALGMLRASIRICPRAPIAWYAAGGTGACTNERAIRISNDRMVVARRLARVQP